MELTRNLLVLMCIGVACVVHSTAQICPYKAETCQCAGDFVECSGLRDIPPVITGTNVTRIKTASFVRGNITTVTKNSLPQGLQELYFSNQPLVQIDNNSLDNSADSLYFIEITQANLTALPAALLKLTNLSILYIDGSPIQKLDLAVLQHIGIKLTELHLKNVGITGNVDWLSNFSVLRILDLSENNRIIVPDTFLSSVRSTLRELSLASVGLTALPPGLLSLDNLDKLDLSGNKMNSSEINKLLAIPSLSKLSSLSLNSVGLEHTFNFSSLKNLTTLDLENNNISNPNEGLLPPSLSSLSLAANNLTSIATVVLGLTNLYRLDLSHNQITTIPNATFANLTRLTKLYLNNNPIKTISARGFSGLVSLDYFYIGFTNLTEIPVALSDLSNPTLHINIEGIPALSCPCQRSQELDTWFSKHNSSLFFTGYCSSSQSLDRYFVQGCIIPSETTTTVPISSTKGTGNAPVLEISSSCTFVSLLLFLSQIFAGLY
ncbi:unnamed protein product [Candidula unifasciata]|uniref:Uncharacterized protein n=1 Tax=Candidula unifasciata TaxID=100452 RepID=A0A8S3ZE55_9EUPU|nr:unnamed protein product [Candidula unifasciata]